MCSAIPFQYLCWGRANHQWLQPMHGCLEAPAYPTATGVWSEFKERCRDPRWKQKLCLQTDISTARTGKEGNNPSQTTRYLNIMNLKLPSTMREASSCISHYNIHTDEAAISLRVTVLFPANHFSCTTTSKADIANWKPRDGYESCFIS